MALSFDIVLGMAISFVPLALGLLGRVTGLSFSLLRSLGLTMMVLQAAGIAMIASIVEMNHAAIILASAVLISGFCALLGQQESSIALPVFPETMVVLGLGLGALCVPVPMNRFFLIGLLAYATFSQARRGMGTFRAKLVIVQLLAVVILSSASWSMDGVSPVLGSLLLGFTFLPLVPFHLPFVSLVESARGALSSLWIVASLAVGLHQLNGLHPFLSGNVLWGIQVLALVTALYGSLKCLGQAQVRNFIAYATVAHLSLLWGLSEVFPGFSRWGISFGSAVALVMSGILLILCFVQDRYGVHPIGILTGLGSPMPRFGSVFTLFITVALLLPLFLIARGFLNLQTGGYPLPSLVIVLFTFLAVWLWGSWYFPHLLHQTVFGKAGQDIPYRDLGYAEMASLGILLLSASWAGMVY